MYQKKEKNGVRCGICPRRCLIPEGGYGFCGGRLNDGGSIRLAAIPSGGALDPIEKKPLYHFYPGSTIVSVGAEGCNFKCVFCQNWTISQKRAEDEPGRMTPDELVGAAESLRNRGNVGIAYTYNEPSISFEFVLETAAKARDRGLKNVLVTNGFMNAAPQKRLYKHVDAANVDIKSIEDSFYKKYCGARLAPVLRYAERAKSMAHLEITNLVIPGLNSSEEGIDRLASWIKSNLGDDTPLHLSAYFPRYRLKIPPTPPETLESLRLVAKRSLKHVYCGNVRSPEGSATICPVCGRRLIERSGMSTVSNLVRNGFCPFCGASANVVGA